MHDESDPIKVTERKSAFVMKSFPLYDKTVEEIFNEVVSVVHYRTNYRLLETGGVSCVNFARRPDGTLNPPGVLVIQCKTVQIRNWWWVTMYEELKSPLIIFDREVWLEMARSGIRPGYGWEHTLHSPRLPRTEWVKVNLKDP